MSSSVTNSSATRFMFEALSRGGPSSPCMTPPRDPGDFLRYSAEPKGAFPRSVHLCLVGHPESVCVTGGRMTPVFVRNIRYNTGAGCWNPMTPAVLRMFRCAKCGWCNLVDVDADTREQLRVCPGCKAKPSLLECAAFHSWGVCGECSGRPIEACPFPALGERRPVDSEAHVA